MRRGGCVKGASPRPQTVVSPVWIAFLTVFRKTRQREDAEIERAHQAQKVCEAEHEASEHIYDRATEDRS